MSDETPGLRTSEGIEDIDAGTSEADRDARISSDEGDYLPETPPDMQPRATEAAMAGKADEQETIDERIAQEVPDPYSAYGAPDDEGGLDARRDRVGGEDPDAIDSDDDFLGDGMIAQREPDVYGGPAEEAALHIVDDHLDLRDEDDPAFDVDPDFDVDPEGDTGDAEFDELVEDDEI